MKGRLIVEDRVIQYLPIPEQDKASEFLLLVGDRRQKVYVRKSSILAWSPVVMEGNVVVMLSNGHVTVKHSPEDILAVLEKPNDVGGSV